MTADGGPELVQLLTPEGERVEHPDYDVDLTDERAARPLPRHGAGPRRSTPRPPPCSARASSGLWASLLGQEAAQVGSGRALARRRLRLPHLPRARRRLVPRASTRSTLLGLFRGVNHGGWDPHEQQLPPLHDRHRLADPARHRLRDGRRSATAPDGARRSPTSATARPARATSTRRSSSPRSTTPRSCSSARTTSGRSPSRSSSRPASRSTSARRASASPASGSTATTSSPCLAVTSAALERRPQRQGPTLVEAFTYRMGAHTTSDDPTRYRRRDRARGVEAKDPIVRLRAYLDAQRLRRRRLLRRSSTAEAEALAERAARGRAARCPTRDPSSMFDHVYAEAHPLVDEERAAVRGVPGVVRRPRQEALMASDSRMAKALNAGAAQGAGGRPEGPGHGRGRRQARRRLPRHRRPAEGLRRGPGHRHPARRVGHRRHRDRPGAARLPAGVRDPVRRLRLPGVRPDRHASSPRCTPARSGTSRCRSSSASPTAAASARSSTTASRPRPTSPTPPGLKVVSPLEPARRATG